MSQQLENTTPFFSANVVFINELYQKYSQNPASVDASWAEFFSQNHDEVQAILADYNGPSWGKRNLKVVGSQDYDISSNSPRELPKKDAKAPNQIASKDLNIRLQNLIANYKRFGHLASNLDPLGLTPSQYVAEIDLKNNDIDNSDLEKEVNYGGQKVKLSQAIANLNYIYCNTIGLEFEYIRDQQQKDWLTREVENSAFEAVSKTEKHKILQEIIRTERFEQFLHKRFPGAKRFSIEGGESSICAVEKIIDASARSGVKKIIIGMAHRGRLNTLTGVMNKPYHRLLSEFQGTPGIPESITKSGDVKYHMGYSSTREIGGNKIDLSLAFNPSHLEAVNTVVAGRIRATQDLMQDASRTQALALLIHGDAAFAGQGSVA